MSFSKLVLLSHPKTLMGEMDTLYELFDLGLEQLHVRKENFGKEDYVKYLNKIPKVYRDKVVLHEYPDLAEKYKLKACHFKSNQTPEGALTKGLSTHSVEEIAGTEADYYYLSPVFESTSKPGYTSNVLKELKNGNTLPLEKKVYALGGVTPENISELQNLGFCGAAVLGYIWNEIHTYKIKENFIRLKEAVDKHF